MPGCFLCLSADSAVCRRRWSAGPSGRRPRRQPLMNEFFRVHRKRYIFAVPFGIPYSERCPVRWVSGLNHQFAKLTYGITVPGVRIPPSPRNKRWKPTERSAFCVSEQLGKLAFQTVLICKKTRAAMRHSFHRLVSQSPAAGGRGCRRAPARRNPGEGNSPSRQF